MGTSTDEPKCIGVVLAGGRATRMGCDKALLDWHGRPLIEHQIDTLRAAGVEAVLVSGERPEYDGIADPLDHAGPLGGLAGVAARIDDTDLLVIPVDMPRLQPELLRTLRRTGRTGGAVRFEGHVLPMRMSLDARSRSALAALLAKPGKRDHSLRAFQERIGIADLPLPHAAQVQLTDCNTPELWREVAG